MTKIRIEQINSGTATDGHVLTADGTGNVDWEAPSGALSDHDHSGTGEGGTFDAANLGSGAATDGYVLTADGAGGAAWEAVAGGSGLDADDVILSNTVANLPAVGTAGRIFLPTNGPYLYRDTGAAWAAWGPIFPMTPPPTADWTWVNQGTASVDTTCGGIYLLAPGVSGTQLRGYFRSAPATPFTVDAGFLMFAHTHDDSFCGIAVRQSDTGEIEVFGVEQNYKLIVQRWNSPTSWNSNSISWTNITAPFRFLRMADDGTYRRYSVSPDGQHWIEVHNCGRTDHLTANQIGIVTNSKDTTSNVGMNLIHWKVG